jgi:citrate lyase beta subunit/acyl dehydratase
MDELRLLDDLLTNMEKEHSGNNGIVVPKVLLPIATETPMAVLNIASIAQGPRVCAITWGCEDLSAELGSYGTRNQSGGEYLDIFRYCRSMCLLAAKAAHVQAIDGIYQNVRDMAGFVNEASDAKYMGFDGKLTLHPDQIAAVHSAFEPTESEFEEANHIVSLWEQGSSIDGGDKRKGSLEYNGKMIDLPHYVRAKKVIARRSPAREHPIQHETNNSASTDEIKASSSSGGSSQTPVSNTIDKGDDDAEGVFPRVNLGKHFEDLLPGMTIRHFLTRTVTEADNVFFTCLTLNPAPIHLDHELSKENAASLSSDPSSKSDGSGKPLFNSMFTLALLVGMSVPELTHGTTVANLGFSEVIFPKPVYPGDTLRAETTILDRRESKSRPTQGIVTFQHIAYNQRGEIVCKATRQALMKKRS